MSLKRCTAWVKDARRDANEHHLTQNYDEVGLVFGFWISFPTHTLWEWIMQAVLVVIVVLLRRSSNALTALVVLIQLILSTECIRCPPVWDMATYGHCAPTVHSKVDFHSNFTLLSLNMNTPVTELKGQGRVALVLPRSFRFPSLSQKQKINCSPSRWIADTRHPDSLIQLYVPIRATACQLARHAYVK